MKSEKGNKILLSRRSFLVGSTAMGASMFLLGTTGCSTTTPSSGTAPESGAVQAGKVEYKYQACPRNCHDTCTLISEVVDGKITRVVGDPTNPITAGTPCVKGHTYKSVVYHPDRILYPMKEPGKKAKENGREFHGMKPMTPLPRS